jgi:hypothetical protein
MNLVSKTPKIELLLQPHELLSLNNKRQSVAVACKNGVVWITCEGEERDQVLRPGRRYVPRTKGSIVIEAISEACVDIEENVN